MLFLRALPQGYFYGGARFGQGLGLLSLAAGGAERFALCPEGDRHLDTFRLYESLQAGCIPVLVDKRSMALSMLGSTPPFPLFSSWPEALNWVQGLLTSEQLDVPRPRWPWWQTRFGELRYPCKLFSNSCWKARFVRLLLIHQTPGQFRQLAPYLLQQGHELVAICYSRLIPLPMRILRYSLLPNRRAESFRRDLGGRTAPSRSGGYCVAGLPRRAGNLLHSCPSGWVPLPT